jgi:hypothetical protein
LQLSPPAFWALTPREFWITFAGFTRRENRARAEAIRHALRTTSYKGNAKRQLEHEAQMLTQYPIKAWTLPEGMTVADMRTRLAQRPMLRTDDDG